MSVTRHSHPDDDLYPTKVVYNDQIISIIHYKTEHAPGEPCPVNSPACKEETDEPS